jgi:hypothetical protein
MTDRTRRVAIIALTAAAAAAATFAAPPALAQYDTTTTTRATTTTTRATTTTTRQTTSTTSAATTTEVPPTTAAPTTTPTTIRDEEDAPILTEEEQESTTTSTAPEPVVVRSEAVQVVFIPGEPAQIVAESDVAFDPDDEPTVTISGTGDDSATVEIEVVASVDENGNLVIDVLVPEDTPESIIVVTIVAIDSLGRERTLVYLFPVAGPSTTTTTDPDGLSLPRGASATSWDELPVVPVANVPLITQKVQAAIPDDTTEQALLAELDAEPSSVLTVEGDLSGDLTDAELAVTVKPIESDNDMARGAAAAIAVGAAALGIVALRRRTPAAQEETR